MAISGQRFNVNYVTGLHRAGTHSYAKYLAERDNLLYIEESKIGWDDLAAAKLLAQGALRNRRPDQPPMSMLNMKGKSGITCQCPGLAHECEELSKYGEVSWVTRKDIDVITSMKNASIEKMAWHIMKGFKDKFPDDPIWKLIDYDGASDVHNNFVGYYTLLVKFKEYLYEKYFSSFVKKVRTEVQSYYDFSGTATKSAPLRPREKETMERYLDQWRKLSFL